jgi:hypothetical protein
MQDIHEAHFGAAFDDFDFDFRFFLADVRAHEVNGVALNVEGSTQHGGIIASGYFQFLGSLGVATQDARHTGFGVELGASRSKQFA